MALLAIDFGKLKNGCRWIGRTLFELRSLSNPSTAEESTEHLHFAWTPFPLQAGCNPGGFPQFDWHQAIHFGMCKCFRIGTQLPWILDTLSSETVDIKLCVIWPTFKGNNITCFSSMKIFQVMGHVFLPLPLEKE